MAAYPGFYAVPGSMFPGEIWPGDTLPAGSSQFAIFTGGETLSYSQYIDTATGRTLVARPGGQYVIAVASGYAGPPNPVPDDGRWITG